MKITLGLQTFITEISRTHIVFTIEKSDNPTFRVYTPRGFKKLVRKLELNMVSYDDERLVAINKAETFKVIYEKIQCGQRRNVRSGGNDSTGRVSRGTNGQVKGVHVAKTKGRKTCKPR